MVNLYSSGAELSVGRSKGTKILRMFSWKLFSWKETQSKAERNAWPWIPDVCRVLSYKRRYLCVCLLVLCRRRKYEQVIPIWHEDSGTHSVIYTIPTGPTRLSRVCERLVNMMSNYSASAPNAGMINQPVSSLTPKLNSPQQTDACSPCPWHF